MIVKFDTSKPEDVADVKRLLISLGENPNGRSPFSISELRALLEALNNGKKILAIKLIRDHFELGLKDAKFWLESVIPNAFEGNNS